MKKIIRQYKGRKESVGSATIFRTIPNPEIQSVGSIIFLDHFPDEFVEPKEPSLPDGSFAHPHRGIATFSYLLEGEMHHFDSRGNQGIIDAGGIQWMNSGNGIVHDEHPSLKFQKAGGPMHGFQLWINLPPEIKAQEPGYMYLKSSDVPEIEIAKESKIRILVGEYQAIKSPIPTHTHHFIHHLIIPSGESLTYKTIPEFEYGAHVARGEAVIDNQILSAKDMAVFSIDGENIHFANNSKNQVDVILFGGEPIKEKIVPYGPFVMNSLAEVQQAYRDFETGKYGTINYFAKPTNT